MDSGTRLRIRRPDVIYELFGHEFVIIDFDSGSYYSLAGTGADIWRLAETGADMGEMIAGLRDRYGSDGADIENAVQEFVAELLREGLIAPAEGGHEGNDLKPGLPAVKSGVSDPPPFAKPAIFKYSDMQELLLLDPIHDVDETGWPGLNPDSDRTE